MSPMPREGESYSQWGEDRLVWEYFGCRTSGFFVEVGANEPSSLSQTWLLEQKGWEGILVEPQPACCERLRASRRRSRTFQAACGAPEQKGKAVFHVAAQSDRSALATQRLDADVTVTERIEVEVVTLDELLAQAGNRKPDFVSIDVEGTELDVLRGFSLSRHRPDLLIVEDHVADLRLHSYLGGQGYKLIKRTGSNNWYVPATVKYPVRLGERLKLFRKMRLGTPLRQFKQLLRGGQNRASRG
ncbi:MAG TPA: FkbM family methyltransferase [Candidatus Acidoferrum sp.]|nr:FkbM family methyltransferase [Candidatus Acidoferrum sp.]